MKVLFEGLWEDEADGWAIADRAYARALSLAGAKVTIRNIPGLWGGTPNERVLEEVKDLLEASAEYDVKVASFCTRGPMLMVPYLNDLTRQFDHRKRGGRLEIFYTMFERDRIDGGIALAFNRFDGLWLTCSANERVAQRSGVWPSKTAWLPFPFFDDDPHLTLAKRPRTKGPLTFYWIGRWEPRKAPDRLLRAFFQAVHPGEARLLMKTSVPALGHRYDCGGFEQEPARAFDQALADAWWWSRAQAEASVEIITRRLSGPEMVALHARGDVYVSASHGEGVDLPAFAAKLAGNRYVGTASGGPDDFLGENDIVLSGTSTFTHPYYEWESGAKWLDVPEADIVEAFRRAVRERASRVHDWLIEAHHARVVGRKMLEDLERRCSFQCRP